MGTDKVVFDGVELSEMIARACGTGLHMPGFFPRFFSYYGSTTCSTSTMATEGDLRSRNSIQTL
jgi:hypothetical protein